MSVKTYDPSLNVVTFRGNIMTGFADGEFIKAAKGADKWTLYKGTDGTCTRVKSLDDSGRVTITLAQSSPSNDILQALYELDVATNQGIGAFLMKDLNGNAIISATNMWIIKTPDFSRGKDLATCEWVLESDKLEIKHG